MTGARADVVLKVVGERARDDAERQDKARASSDAEADEKAEDKERAARALRRQQVVSRPLPPDPLPPMEPEMPVLSPLLGQRMTDFAAARPGESVALHGGRVIRTKDGFAAQRYGGETTHHDKAHEAALAVTRHAGKVEHDKRMARHGLHVERHRQVAQDAKAAAADALEIAPPAGAEESALEELAIPHLGSPATMHFDPRLHQRDRVGKFTDMLVKLMRAPHGSTLHLPHGHAVQRRARGLEVTGGGKPVELDTPHGAAGEALFRHVQAEVGRGADFRHESSALLHDLDTARRGAMSAGDTTDMAHLEGRANELRIERGKRLEAHLATLKPQRRSVPPKTTSEGIQRFIADIDKVAGRRNEPLPENPGSKHGFPPGVSVTRAVDSDRGEIDVGGVDADGNDIWGERYERDEHSYAREDAFKLAQQHGVEFQDEIKGDSDRRFESPAAKAKREMIEDAWKKYRAAMDKWHASRK